MAQMQVFVSHSHDDPFCRGTVQALRGAGADVWYDEHHFGSGHLVDTIERALAELRDAGAPVLDAAPRPTAEGRGIFLHPKGTNGVLLELVQRDGEAEQDNSAE